MIAPDLTLEDTRASKRNPWAWVPSLYFAQGIPYVMVMTVSVIMYKNLGISNTDIALYTSWLYLPWVIKPLWSPIVDLLGTKRRWILVMQFCMAVMLAMVALSIPGPRFFQYTLAFFWLMAFSSATHDIAADGFYMLGLEQHQQAAFVGVRSTFYRIATIAAQGLLVMLAGSIESRTGLTPAAIDIAVRHDAVNTAIVLPETVDADLSGPAGEMSIRFEPNQIDIGLTPRDADEVDALLDQARELNTANHFYAAPASASSADEGAAASKDSWWSSRISGPLGGWLRSRFGDPRRTTDTDGGNIAVASLRLTAPPAPGKEVVVSLSRRSGDARIDIAEGGRLTFTEHNWDKPALLVFKLDPQLRTDVEASFSATSGNSRLAWMIVSSMLAVVFLLFCIYHKFAVPYPSSDGPSRSGGAGSVVSEFFATFVAFFRKQHMSVVIGFLLFFRFAEAQLVKLVTPFLLDPRDIGGLGLTTQQVGFVYGTIGIAALTAGGLLGGYLVSRQGLRFWIWPMVLTVHLPDLVFIYLAYVQPESLKIISSAVAVEQFGYGFGFTAYMLFMIMVAEGKHKTAHYAICTGFMALGMMVPGMFSGWIQENIGYQHFFVWVMLSTVPGFLVVALVRIPPGFGRKVEA